MFRCIPQNQLNSGLAIDPSTDGRNHLFRAASSSYWPDHGIPTRRRDLFGIDSKYFAIYQGNNIVAIGCDLPWPRKTVMTSHWLSNELEIQSCRRTKIANEFLRFGGHGNKV